MAFDLNALNTAQKAEEGSVLEVLHPTENTKLGIRITLAGIDSEIYRKTTNKIANKRVKQINPGRPNSFLQTAEEKEATDLTILAACTLGWEGIDMNGQEFPFSQENARALYANPGFGWLREQVDKFIADRANFLAS